METNSARVGIVTVLFNSDEVLPGFFESLARLKDVNYKVYIVDNSKLDTGCRLSLALAKEYKIDIEVLFNDANVGVAKGNNQGIEMALRDGCDFVLLSNNDIEFEDSDLLKKLLLEMNRRHLAAICPKIYFYGLDKVIWFAGGRFSKIRASTPHQGEGQSDVGQYDELSTIDYAPTCFLLLRSSVFSEIGVMDEKYFVYYDDSDFLWRMKTAGMSIGFLPAAAIYHKVSHSTGGNESEFSIYYGSRNRIYFIQKNYHLAARITSLTFFFFSRAIKAFRFSKPQIIAMARGIKDGLKLRHNP